MFRISIIRLCYDDNYAIKSGSYDDIGSFATIRNLLNFTAFVPWVRLKIFIPYY